MVVFSYRFSHSTGGIRREMPSTPLITSEDTDMTENTLTQEQLKEYFSYDQNAGELIRTKMPGQPDQSSDYCQQFIGKPMGAQNKEGYLRVVIFQKKYAYHRVIFLYHYGYLPDCIDHRNRDKSDNRIENLRDATASLNGHNREAKGYTRSGCGKKFSAKIHVDGESVGLGTYDTEAEAAAAYQGASLYVWGEDSPYYTWSRRGKESKVWGAKRHK